MVVKPVRKNCAQEAAGPSMVANLAYATTTLENANVELNFMVWNASFYAVQAEVDQEVDVVAMVAAMAEVPALAIVAGYQAFVKIAIGKVVHFRVVGMAPA